MYMFHMHKIALVQYIERSEEVEHGHLNLGHERNYLSRM